MPNDGIIWKVPESWSHRPYMPDSNIHRNNVRQSPIFLVRRPDSPYCRNAPVGIHHRGSWSGPAKAVSVVLRPTRAATRAPSGGIPDRRPRPVTSVAWDFFKNSVKARVTVGLVADSPVVRHPGPKSSGRFAEAGRSPASGMSRPWKVASIYVRVNWAQAGSRCTRESLAPMLSVRPRFGAGDVMPQGRRANPRAARDGRGRLNRPSARSGPSALWRCSKLRSQ
jgi:hypothetical protein